MTTYLRKADGPVQARMALVSRVRGLMWWFENDWSVG